MWETESPRRARDGTHCVSCGYPRTPGSSWCPRCGAGWLDRIEAPAAHASGDSAEPRTNGLCCEHSELVVGCASCGRGVHVDAEPASAPTSQENLRNGAHQPGLGRTASLGEASEATCQRPGSRAERRRNGRRRLDHRRGRGRCSERVTRRRSDGQARADARATVQTEPDNSSGRAHAPTGHGSEIVDHQHPPGAGAIGSAGRSGRSLLAERQPACLCRCLRTTAARIAEPHGGTVRRHRAADRDPERFVPRERHLTSQRAGDGNRRFAHHPRRALRLPSVVGLLSADPDGRTLADRPRGDHAPTLWVLMGPGLRWRSR